MSLRPTFGQELVSMEDSSASKVGRKTLDLDYLCQECFPPWRGGGEDDSLALEMADDGQFEREGPLFDRGALPQLEAMIPGGLDVVWWVVGGY